MQDYVSTRWIRVAGLVASMSIVWTVFIPYGFPWMVFLWVSLAGLGALWLVKRSPRSIAQLIDDVEGEPVPAAARVRKAVPSWKAGRPL